MSADNFNILVDKFRQKDDKFVTDTLELDIDGDSDEMIQHLLTTCPKLALKKFSLFGQFRFQNVKFSKVEELLEKVQKLEFCFKTIQVASTQKFEEFKKAGKIEDLSCQVRSS